MLIHISKRVRMTSVDIQLVGSYQEFHEVIYPSRLVYEDHVEVNVLKRIEC